MPSNYHEQMSHIRFPRDVNTAAVAVQYVLDPNAQDVYPLGGTTLPDGTVALNTNLVGGVLQADQLSLNTAPYVAKGLKDIAATLNDYNSAATGQFDTRLLLHKTIVIKNTGAASLIARIYGSVDGTEYDIVLLPPVTVAAGMILIHYSNEFFYGIRVDTKSAALNTPTTSTIKIAGISS